MQVNLNQSVNQLSPNFNAKLNINNKSCYVITKDVIADMNKVAKRIGTNKDTITIEIGKFKSYSDSWSEMGHSYTLTTLSQEITANSNINGLEEIKNIGYSTTRDAYPGDLAANNIFKYLYELIDSKK